MVGKSAVENRSAVFLDRDGVLNRPILRGGRGYAPKKVEDFVLLPGVGDAVRQLKNAGYLVVVVTNQKDVGRGITSAATLEEMHDILRREVPVDDIRVCTCDNECPCYKPAPGMLIEAAKDWGIAFEKSAIVGDTWRDVGAGKAAGVKTIFVDWGYEVGEPCVPDVIVKDLTEAVGHILSSGEN